MGQQQKQFGAELDLGYANLNARNNQPAPAPTPSLGDSMWGELDTGGGGSSPEPIDWEAAQIQANKTREELYQGGWTG